MDLSTLNELLQHVMRQRQNAPTAWATNDGHNPQSANYSDNVQPPVSNIYTQPPVSNIYTQPPVSNIYTQPPVSNIYTQPPVSNFYTQPLVSSIYTQPPVSNIYTQPPVSNIYTQPPVSNIYTQPPVAHSSNTTSAAQDVSTLCNLLVEKQLTPVSMIRNEIPTMDHDLQMQFMKVLAKTEIVTPEDAECVKRIIVLLVKSIAEKYTHSSDLMPNVPEISEERQLETRAATQENIQSRNEIYDPVSAFLDSLNSRSSSSHSIAETRRSGGTSSRVSTTSNNPSSRHVSDRNTSRDSPPSVYYNRHDVDNRKDGHSNSVRTRDRTHGDSVRARERMDRHSDSVRSRERMDEHSDSIRTRERMDRHSVRTHERITSVHGSSHSHTNSSNDSKKYNDFDARKQSSGSSKSKLSERARDYISRKQL